MKTVTDHKYISAVCHDKGCQYLMTARLEIKRCQLHDLYYVNPDAGDREKDPHKDCQALPTERQVADGRPFELQWAEVVYYLNKLRKLRALFNELRVELL